MIHTLRHKSGSYIEYTYGTTCIYILFIYVPEGMRSRGVGSGLLNDFLEDKGHLPIRLYATNDYGSSDYYLERFYTKFGFKYKVGVLEYRYNYERI